jgi:hypothetical protein
MTVYLAGMAANVGVMAACLLVLVAAGPRGLLRQLLCVVVAETLLFLLPVQLMVFARTDLYFVLQDLKGCANLYADGSAYLGHLARRLTRRGGPNPDPSEEDRGDETEIVKGGHESPDRETLPGLRLQPRRDLIDGMALAKQHEDAARHVGNRDEIACLDPADNPAVAVPALGQRAEPDPRPAGHRPRFRSHRRHNRTVITRAALQAGHSGCGG